MHFQYLGLGAGAADMSRGGVIRPPGGISLVQSYYYSELVPHWIREIAAKNIPETFTSFLKVYIESDVS